MRIVSIELKYMCGVDFRELRWVGRPTSALSVFKHLDLSWLEIKNCVINIGVIVV